MTRLALPAVLLALTVPVAFAACGSSSSAPSKSEYITKADGVCKKANDKINADAQKAIGSSPTPAQVAAYQKDKVLPALEQESSDLKALDKPKNDGSTIDAIYSSLDAAIAKSKSTGKLDNTTFADANTKAKAYGLKVCGGN
jgi:hypothetical protein